ncbi:MAG: hypothetical protein KGI98_17605, partial [Euryarchaeota archaeon]|nr:hypothetical protein [Euryarchaeota archaeon]
PSGKGWEEATRSGARIGLSVLAREGLVLALEEKERVIPGERLQHIGLEGDEGELQRLEGLVWGLGGQVVTRGAGLLVFDDAYGVKWEITSHHALEPADRSSGARAGKWFRSPVAAQGHRGG